jgi:hypothetical protein
MEKEKEGAKREEDQNEENLSWPNLSAKGRLVELVRSAHHERHLL